MSNKANRIWLSSPTKHGLEMGIYDRDILYKLDVHCGGILMEQSGLPVRRYADIR